MKLFRQILSVVLAAVMLLCIVPFSASAATAPSFKIAEKSNDGTTLVVSVNLTSGSFNALDLSFDVSGLTCKSIAKGSALKNAIGNDETDMIMSTNANAPAGKSNVSCSSSTAYNFTGEFITATFTINNSSNYYFKLNFESCAVMDNKGNSVQVNPSVTGTIKHTTSATVSSVTVNDVSMNYKKTAKINPVIDAPNGLAYTVEFTSADKSIVTVDENGNVYGAKKGTTKITCTVTDASGNIVEAQSNVEVTYAWWQWIIVIVLFGWIWY